MKHSPALYLYSIHQAKRQPAKRFYGQMYVFINFILFFCVPHLLPSFSNAKSTQNTMHGQYKKRKIDQG